MGGSFRSADWTAPTGPVPNKGPATVATIWMLFALASIFLAARVYCKVSKSIRLWWDDWVLILSWVAFLVDAIASQTAVSLGFGKYPDAIPLANMVAIGIHSNIGTTFGILALAWSKTSLAITLLRLMDSSRRAKALLWVVILAVNVSLGLNALFTWIQCTPVAKTWDHAREGTCWDTEVSNGYSIFAGVFSGTMDVLLALLPWRLLWAVRMKREEKLGVGVAMSMGVFAGATAYIKSSTIPLLGSDDFTYNGCSLLVWAAAEISTTIMASCIPVLHVLLKDVRNKICRRCPSLSAHHDHDHPQARLYQIKALDETVVDKEDGTKTPPVPTQPPSRRDSGVEDAQGPFHRGFDQSSESGGVGHAHADNGSGSREMLRPRGLEQGSIMQTIGPPFELQGDADFSRMPGKFWRA